MKPNDIIREFDKFLTKRGASFTGVAIGGAPLNLLGIIFRETRDCDIIDPVIPDKIQSLAKEFAEQVRLGGNILADDWLNNGPISMKDKLPSAWEKRLVPAFKGKALALYTLERQDLLKTKLQGLCDRGMDKADCIAMRPSKEELRAAIPWLKDQDGNPDWPKHVEGALADLAKDLGCEL